MKLIVFDIFQKQFIFVTMQTKKTQNIYIYKIINKNTNRFNRQNPYTDIYIYIYIYKMKSVK